jgi:hypothetical protein
LQPVPTVHGGSCSRPRPALNVYFVELGSAGNRAVIEPRIERFEVVGFIPEVEADEAQGLLVLEMQGELVGFP